MERAQNLLSLRAAGILVLGVVAAAVGLAVAAPARPAAAQTLACASLAHTNSFHGHVSDTFDGTVSVSDAGQGGRETVTLSRQANLEFALRKLATAPIIPQRVFLGRSTGGSIGVDDSYTHTGTGFHGKLQGSTEIMATALLVLYPRTCQYQLEMSFLGAGSFMGDETIAPDTQFGGFAYTPRRQIPASLHLAGLASITAYANGCSKGQAANPAKPPDLLGCYEFSGGWTTDYALLEECGAPFGGTCAPNDAPEGNAHINWNLTPTTKKQ